MTYEDAICEWVARRLRGRGHRYARTDVRNVEFAIGEGWHGTDVTPGDPDHVALRCEIRKHGRDGWKQHEEELVSVTPAVLIAECLAIYGADSKLEPHFWGRRVV
jgi:hypothetical protein